MPKRSKPDLKNLVSLPRLSGMVLEGGKRTLGVYLRQDKETVQPQVALWVDNGAGTGQEFVRAIAIIPPDHGPGASGDKGLSETLQALQTAFTGPFMPAPPGLGLNVRPGLPEIVRVDDEELATAVRSLLEPLNIKVEVTTELRALKEVFEEMSRGIGADENAEPPPPFEWELDQSLLMALYRAADVYTKLAPWNYMPDNPPVEIRLGEHGPQTDVSTIYASILGGAGMVQGIAFYNSLADYYDLIEKGYQRAAQEQELGQVQEDAEDTEEEVDFEQELAILQQMGAPIDRMSRQEALEMLSDLRESEEGAEILPELKDCLTLWLEERDELDPTYLEWLEEHGLKYTRRKSIPFFSRVITGGETRVPDTREAEALRLAIEGLNQIFKKHAKQLQTGMLPVEGLRMRVSTQSGDERPTIDLKYPASHYDEDHFEKLAQQEAASGKAFNIYELVFDHSSDEYLEDKAQRYQEQLLALFRKSPESRLLGKQARDRGGWVEPVLELGINYLGVTPAQMTPAQFRELLFEVFPRKVTVSASEAPQIVRELRVFWEFLGREFRLPNAQGCLKVLNEQAAVQLEEELGDPASFGIAKSFLMEGLERGFDLSSQEGIEEWMNTYNTEITGHFGGIGVGGDQKPLPVSEKLEKGGNSHRSGRKKRR